ncbi:MAG: NAD-dependent epimerase/dehydratase family protein [Acidimicrobiales bacterium]
MTGGAGLVGSHVCRALLAAGTEVVCLDDLSTSDGSNVADLAGDRRFHLVVADVTEPFTVDGPLDAVLHLASPASPQDYARLPLQTLRAGSAGTEHALQVALDRGARFLLASTSEVYGDPLEHPQRETYWGNVNPVGPRSVYDEAKRYAEALTAAYRRERGADTAIVRIFNTYGPGMRPDDGRVVSRFLTAAQQGEPLTVHGDGSQTRSFCYVEDEVRGLLALLHSDLPGPVNIGNPTECTVLQLARLVIEVTGSGSPIEHRPLPVDDPAQRRPDITLATTALGWKPEVKLRDGLALTAAHLRERAAR